MLSVIAVFFQPPERFLESKVVFQGSVLTVVPDAKGCNCGIDKLSKNFNIAHLMTSIGEISLELQEIHK